MKLSQVLAVSVLALMVLSALPLQEAQAQGAYSEKLNVFVAGSDALWYFTFNGVNGSSKLTALESTPGLSWYNVTAIKTTSWQSDFQVFGAKGYNLLPVPFVPSQGLFLSVGSDSYSNASSAASALGSYLLTSFVSLSNGTGTFSFYSPVSFDALVPSTLLSFLPSTEGGFAQAISKTSFLATGSPFVVLEGTKSTSGFDHSLVVGSISSAALDTASRLNVMAYFGSTISSLNASSHSTSSSIEITTLDGILSSSDAAVISSDTAHFSGSYALRLQAGKRVSKINATVVEQPPELLATRAVDVGVLHTNDDLAVTLSLRNISPTVPITKVSFSDNWWNATGVFKLVSGSSTVPSSGIGIGDSVTPVYVLQYTGTATGSMMIPASVVHYRYVVGSVTFNATVVLNPIRLSLGEDDAVVYATVTPTGGFAKSVGSTQSLNVTVTNVGTLPASSVVVAGQSIPGLAAKSGSSSGGTATVAVSQSALGLLGINTTQTYMATYADPAGNSLNATTNAISDVFSHSSMKLGSPALVVGAQLAPLSNSMTNLTLSFATTNSGPVNITSFLARAPLPAGLGCGAVSGEGLTCSGGQLKISYPIVNASSTLNAHMEYNLTSSLNYILSPIPFFGMTAGYNVTGRSNAVAVPTGLVLSKQFVPAQLFGGMSASVTVSATNSGPDPIYNATVSTAIDGFDTLSGSSSLSKTSQTIASGGNLTFSYGVSTSQVSGSEATTNVTASLFFGGTSFSIQGRGPAVEVYQPLRISISTSPTTPEEGKNFTITFQITNPSGVAVSNVLFTLPVPSGLSLSHLQDAELADGSLTVSVASMASYSTANATAVGVASSGILIPFSKAKLTFTYAGTTLSGTLPSASGIGIGEDVLTRYVIPTAFILLVVLFTAFYVRRKAAVSAPASQK